MLECVQMGSDNNIILVGKRLTRFAIRIYRSNMSIPRKVVHTLPIHRARCGSCKGFSLVEVVLAIGVVSFAMMAVLGILPVGLKSAQESRGQVATANISRQLQGELQQLSFQSNGTDAISVQTLADNPFYFTTEGTRTNESGAYYIASFQVNGASLPGLAFDPSQARRVTVTLTYPKEAPVENRQRTVFSLLLAKQKTD